MHVAIRAEHEDEVWNDRDFKQWKGNMQRASYDSNTTEDGVSKMEARARSMIKGPEAEGVIVGNVTECLTLSEEINMESVFGTPTNGSADEDDEEQMDQDTHGNQNIQQVAEQSDEEELVEDLGSSK